ncbi:TIGR02221 family CRISPR-associated protein [Deferribacter abyssi]|uniref:TIGR02221 family CRISPR-associated protein n=1 Tax=Deferribacter abyssi TaxID=213806 RepID=UPI003C1C0E14
MGKTFISFLGTGNYINCNYYFQTLDNKVDNVKFVQEALLKIFCSDFNENDKVVIFMTNEAEQKYWDELKNKICWIDAEIKNVIIPFGKSEKEIWDIFDKLYDSVDYKDEVILDVTHSFRSLPMLALVFLNYSKSMKNIKIKGIYYGAFDTLGPRNKVEKMDIKDRNAPIFDLTPFHSLQQWSIASDNFITFGNPQKLIELMKYSIYSDENFLSKTSKNIIRKQFLPALNNIWEFISTVRGKNIISGEKFITLKKHINNLRNKLKGTTPAEKLLMKVQEKFDGFEEDSLKNGIIAVEFCLKHGMVQQGITIAREIFLSYVMKELELETLANKPYEIFNTHVNSEKITKNKALKKLRELISSIASLMAENRLSELKTNIKTEIVEKIKESKLVNLYCRDFKKLTDMRNSINHAGITDDIKSRQIGSTLHDFYKNVLCKLKDEVN